MGALRSVLKGDVVIGRGVHRCGNLRAQRCDHLVYKGGDGVAAWCVGQLDLCGLLLRAIHLLDHFLRPCAKRDGLNHLKRGASGIETATYYS